MDSQLAANKILAHLPLGPKVGIILGSGLSRCVDRLSNALSIPYSDIPGFSMPTVQGHCGRWFYGHWNGCPVYLMQGRLHYYEGISMHGVTFPIRVMKALGVQTLIITTASGSLKRSLCPCDIMIIKDHINLMGTNPLIGLGNVGMGMFPDMVDIYTESLRKEAKWAAEKLGIEYKEGVHIGVSGPMYETRAEVEYFRKIGGDTVSMSTVPEAIMAKALGISVLGFSFITNYSGEKDTHAAVLSSVNRQADRWGVWIDKIMESGNKWGG